MSWNIAEILKGLRGWRRAGLSFAGGSVSVLALAPFHAYIVMFATVPLLIWLLDGAAAQSSTRRQAMRSFAGIAWWWGFGYFLFGVYWIAHAFIADGNFLWLLPFAVTLMPAGLALFFAAAGGLAALYWPSDWRRVIVLALLLTAAEWLRGHIFTGFPWNLLGYTLTASEPFLQLSSIFGIYGLSFLAVLIFGGIVATGIFDSDVKSLRAAPFGYGVLGVFIVLYAAGLWRSAHDTSPVHEKVKMRLVQPAIPQAEKWKKENRKAIFEDYLRLSKSVDGKSLDGVTHLIWPEAALPFLLLRAGDKLRPFG